MSRGLLTVFAIAAIVGGCSARDLDFTGIWKGNCEDYYGVQIRPADGGLYVVTFCGLSGCMAPGEWTPNSRILRDPVYQVVSATTLRIKRNDAGYFTYHKCSADPFWPTKPGY
jgi:hypothetical protein